MIVCHDLIQKRNVFIEFIGKVQEESTRMCVALFSCYQENAELQSLAIAFK